MDMRFWMKMFFMAFVFLGLVSALSVPSYTISKSAYEPGDIGITTITVTNSISEDRATGLSMTLYSPTDLTITGAPKIADIDPGGTAIVSIPFRIDSDASPGIYLLNVEFNGFSGNEKITNTVSVPITIADLPILTVDAGSSVLSGTDSIEITLTNNGGPANQMRLNVQNSSGISLYGTNEVYIGDLDKSTKVNLTLDARSAADGPIKVPLEVTYNDEIGATHTDTLNIGLTVKKEKLDLRFNQLSSITTREEGTLQMEVINNGEDVKDLRISFMNSSLSLTDASEIKAGDLSKGQKTTVSSEVIPYLSPGLNLVQSKITWIEKDVNKEQQITIPITVTSDSDVGVYLESNPSPLVVGAEHTISVLVSNLGSYQIDNVDVGLDSNAFTPLDITPRQYIGSLTQDDFSTVQFRVKTNGDSGEFPINVSITYRDASGQWINKTITQDVKITSVQSSGNGSLTLVIVLVVVAAILVWYFKLRKKD